MEVILLERVAKLGQMGEVVRVKDGFARNFLLPKGKALRANKESRVRFETMKVELETRNLAAKGEAQKVADKLAGQNFSVLRQASETGHLVRVGLEPRPCRPDFRTRLQDRPHPDCAQCADQVDRAAQGCGCAASGNRRDCQRRRGAQCRRSRAHSPR